MALAALATLALAAACGKKDASVNAAPTATSLTASAASAATVWHFTVDSKGTSHIDMPGLREHILADTTGAAGSIDVVPADLGQSRGLVRMDLATLSTSTFHDGRDGQQTEHARTWLEAVVDGKTNETMRWADFAIRSVDGASATDLGKVAVAKDGADDVKKVTAVVHGDLLVHGHKVPKDDPVELTFRYANGAGGAADAKPTRVDIRSTQPIRVVLKEHEVAPRDPAGKLAEWTTSLIAKVAETADVTVNISAVPAP